ncbi:IS66 family insertion sequence element accessory protein TnpB [Rhizobium leguminosarum]|uniref:IS66 family insertion sequence element accessory protein TnpB n=1 Tax=Rhizobium leguminosarum TaxID=384 RepID=UPI003CCABFD1
MSRSTLARAVINSLAVLVEEPMAPDAFAPAVFAFCSQRRDRMKLLSSTGPALWWY